MPRVTPWNRPAEISRRAGVGGTNLVAAQHAHAVWDDPTLEQILDMIVAMATIQGDPAYHAPILQNTHDGLRPRPMANPRSSQHVLPSTHGSFITVRTLDHAAA